MNVMRRISAALAASALLLTQGCATAESYAPRVEAPPPGSVPGPALWEVSDEDTTIYLFGTVHALKPDAKWMDNRIAGAFNSSDEMVTEVDMAEASKAGSRMAEAGMLPAGQNLRELMKPDDRKEFEAALVALGLPVESMDRFEPWFAAMTLSLLPVVKAGYNPDSGVESRLSGEAGGKKHEALETIDEQIALFDGLPMENQLAFLDQSVEAVPEAGDMLGAMIDEWLKGDAVALAELLNSELTDPVLHARLLTDRNANWAVWIQQRLEEPGTVFMAVGAGHLAGKGSVQDQLEQRGLKVTRIWQ